MKMDRYGYSMSENKCVNGCSPFQDCCDNGPVCQDADGFETGLSCPGMQPPAEKLRKNCCCKKSMIEALKLLCNSELAEIIDFEKFAFLTDNFIVGARLVLFKLGSDDKDNLSNLDGKFKKFLPCNCDLIEIEGSVAYDVPLPLSITDIAEQLVTFINNIIDIIGDQPGILGTVADVLKEILKTFDPFDFSEELLQSILDFLIKYFTTIPKVDTASLCALDAIAFQVKYVGIAEADDSTREKVTQNNYERAKDILRRKLERVCDEDCAECRCKCRCDDCCCADSVKDQLLSSNLSRTATLTAGSLTLRDVTVLGAIGDVLVFANEKKRRFYLVCANAVQFLA